MHADMCVASCSALHPYFTCEYVILIYRPSPPFVFATPCQLEDTLTNDGAPPGLTGLIKGLIKNYKLDESLQQGAKYIESPGDRNAAASAGREALEYLAQTAEYFPVEVDDR